MNESCESYPRTCLTFLEKSGSFGEKWLVFHLFLLCTNNARLLSFQEWTKTTDWRFLGTEWEKLLWGFFHFLREIWTSLRIMDYSDKICNCSTILLSSNIDVKFRLLLHKPTKGCSIFLFTRVCNSVYNKPIRTTDFSRYSLSMPIFAIRNTLVPTNWWSI